MTLFSSIRLYFEKLQTPPITIHGQKMMTGHIPKIDKTKKKEKKKGKGF